MATADERRAWAREQGFKVSDKGKLPDAVNEAYYAAMGEQPPDVETMIPEPGAGEGGPGPGDVFGQGDGKKDPKSARSRSAPKSGPAAPDPAILRDIQGKTAFMLTMPAMAWQARDQLCGSVAVQQVPAISTALARLFAQSPEVVEWFTGKGGNFMAWLDLAAACQPLVQAVVQHHVLHSIGDQGEPIEPADLGQYAA